MRTVVLLFSLACEAQVLIKQGNDPQNGGYIEMQVATKRPYQRSDGQMFTPAIGVRCSQIGDHRKTEFFIVTGGIDSSMLHGGVADVPLQVDEGNLVARRFTLRPEDGTLFAEFKPPFLLLQGKAIYVEFLPSNSVTKAGSWYDTTALGAEFNKHSECVPPAPPREAIHADAKNSTDKKESDSFPVKFSVLSGSMTTTDCYMTLQDGTGQYFVKGLGFIHCRTFYPGQQLRGRIGTGFRAGYIDLRWSDGGKDRTARYQILRIDLLPR